MENLGITKINLDMNYANPYERIKNTYFDTEYFDNDMWDAAAERGGDDFNAYSQILMNQNKLPSLSEMNKNNAFRLGDFDTKLQKMSLELNKDALNSDETRKKRTKTLYDDYGKQSGTQDLGEMTDYEYYTYMLDEYGVELERQEYLDTIEQLKKERGWLPNLIANVTGLVGEFVVSIPNGVMKAVDFITNLEAALVDSGRALFGDLTWKQVDERFRNRFTDDTWLNEGVTELISDKTGGWLTDNVITKNYMELGLESIDEWEKFNTTLYTVRGESTDFNQMIKGVVRQVGEIVGLWGVGKAVGVAGEAVGASVKTIQTANKVVHSTVFYGSMFQGRMKDSIIRDPNNEHSTWELLAVNGAATAIDACVEILSGKLLGFSDLDAATLGVSSKRGLIQLNITNPVLRVFVESLVEGAEEAVQEFTSWLTGTIADAAGGYDNFYSQDFDPMDYVWAFVGGVMMSSMIGSVTKTVEHFRNNQVFSSNFLTEQMDVHNLMNDEGFIKLRQDYDNSVKIRDEIVNRKNSSDSVFDENSETYFQKGSKEFDTYYDSQIVEQDREISAIENELKTYEIDYASRAEHRRLTYESLDKKQQGVFKRGILGLFNAMSDALDEEWYAKKTKRNAKVALYYSSLAKTAYRMITEMYSSIGQERFDRMNKLLTELETRAVNATSDYQFRTELKNIVSYTLNDITDLVSNFKVDEKTTKNAVNLVKETSETIKKLDKTKPDGTKSTEHKINVEGIFNGEDFNGNDGKPLPIQPDDNAEDADKNSVTETMVNNAKVLKNEGIDVLLTNANGDVHSNENTIMLPINRAEDSPEAIKNSAAVTRTVNTISANLPKNIKDEITKSFNAYNGKLKNKLSFENILRVLLFDSKQELFTYMLNTTSKFTVRVFTNLKTWAEGILKQDTNGVLDTYLQKSLNTMIKNMTPAIITYCKNMKDTDDAILSSIYKVLSKNQIADIQQTRYNYLLRDKVVEKPNNLTDVEKNILNQRINNLILLSNTVKDKLKSQLFSDKLNSRIKAIDTIDNYYDGIFNGPYNNKIYLKDNGTTGVQTFNWWLEQNNLTVTKLLNSNNIVLEQMKFAQASNQRFRFVLNMNSDSGISIEDHRYKFDEQYEFNAIKSSDSIEKYHKLAAENGLLTSDLLLPFLSEKVNKFELDMLTVDDVLKRPEYYLSDEVKSKIGKINRETVRDYINDYFSKNKDSLTYIMPDVNGVMRLFVYDNISDILSTKMNKPGVYEKYIGKEMLKLNEEKRYNISEFISSKLLTNDILKDIKVIIRREGETYYTSQNNTIYISQSDLLKKSKDLDYRLRTFIVHEFKHALDMFNGFNEGMSDIELPKEVKDDIDKHVKFDKNVKNKYDMFVYLLSGELHAFGFETVIKQIPNVVKTNADGTVTMTLPWGSQITYDQFGVIKFNDKQYRQTPLIDEKKSIDSRANLIEDYYEEFTDTKTGEKRIGLRSDVKKTRHVVQNDYEAALDYVEKINNAKKASTKKNFGNDDVDYGLPIETLMAMKLGKYDARSDVKYRTAKALIRAKESKDASVERSTQRKEKGEIYNYGYLSKKRAKDTVAEYYINNGRYENYRGKFTEGMQRFLYNVDVNAIDEELSKLIRNEQPTQDGIFAYIRDNYDKMNDYTFNIIKESFFPNSNFKTANDVIDFVDVLPMLYAMHGSLLENEAFEYGSIKLPVNATNVGYKSFLNGILKNDLTLEKHYALLLSKYPSDIDFGQTFLTALKYYDETFESIGYVGGITRYQSVLENFNSRTEQKNQIQSLDSQITRGKGDDKSTLLGDIIADTKGIVTSSNLSTLREQAIDIYREHVERNITKLLNQAKLAVEKYNDDSAKMSIIQKKLKLKIAEQNKLIEEFEDKIAYVWTDKQIEAFVLRHELTQPVTEQNFEQLTEFEKLIENMSAVKRTSEQAKESLRKYINANLYLVNKLTISYLPDEIREYFTIDKNGRGNFDFDKLKENGKTKPVNELDELHDNLKTAFKQLRNIIKINNDNEKLRNKLQKEESKRIKITEKLNKKSDALKRTTEEIKNMKIEKHTKVEINKNGDAKYKFKVSDNLEYISNKPIPEILYKLLTVNFSHTAKNKIQGVSDETSEEHIVFSIDEFAEYNAERLENLTHAQAMSIVEYYETAALPLTSNDPGVEKLIGLREVILTYILAADKRQIISISDSERQRINKILTAGVKDASRRLKLWSSVVNKVNPWRKMAAQLRKMHGIEFDEDDVKALDEYIAKGDMNAFTIQLKYMYNKLLKRMKAHKAEHKYHYMAQQILNYMRAAMLSAPSTTIRNKMSNVTIDAFGAITKPIGKLSGNMLNKLRNMLNSLMPNKVKPVVEGYREGQIDLSTKLNMKKDPNDGQYVVKDKKYHDDSVYGNYIDSFEKSGIMELIDYNISKFDTMQRRPLLSTGQIDSSDLTYLLIEKIMSKVSEEMSVGKIKLMKPLQLLAKKFNIKEADTKIPQSFTQFIFKLQSDNKWINKRFKKYFAVLLKEYNLESEINKAYELSKDNEKVNPHGILLSNEKFTEALTQAYGYAAYEYMHRGNFISDLTNFLRANHPNAAIAVQFFAPFLSGGFNWFMESLKYNPVGFLVSLGRFITLDKQIEIAQRKYDDYKTTGKGRRPAYNPRFVEYSIRNDLGKGVWGTVLFGLAMILASVGFIKKDDDDDKYKLNFGGFYLDISNLFGSEPLLIGATVVDAARDENLNLLDVLDATLSTTFENFFMTDLINSMKYNASFSEMASDKLFNMIGSFVPNFWKAFVRVTKNSKMKYSPGVLGDLEYLAYSVVPVMNLRKRIDPYTGEVEVQYSDSLIVRILNESGILAGIKIKTNVPSDIEDIFSKLNVGVSELTGDYKDIGKLDYVSLNATYGTLNKKSFTDFINDKVAYEVTDSKDKNKKVTLKYSKMTDEQKRQVIERIKRNNANYAKIYVWTKSGHKYYTNSSERRTLASLGITENVYLKNNKLDGFVN